MYDCILIRFHYDMHPGKVNLHIVDRAKQHYSEEVCTWVREFNETKADSGDEGRIVLAYIAEHLTSILQVGDVVFNKPIKDSIRRRYWRFRDQQPLAESERGRRFKLDDRKDDMVTFVEDAIADYNDCALKDGRVRRAFEKCGSLVFYGSFG